MWKLLRRDAVTVWSSQVVAKRFARYKAIIDLQLSARFLIAKNIEINFNPKEKTEILWQLHNKSRLEFQNNLQREISNKEPQPPQSFLDLKTTLAHRILQECHFCEHRCQIDRTSQTGFCGVSEESYVSSAFLHTGEEAPLVPSGTIFFSGCNLRCAHCQNFDISCNPTNGSKISAQELARIADKLASQGAKNINYVGGDPTPNIHTILNSMKFQQYNITQLWNSNMYLTNEAMELLLDVIDFWLPDLKYYSEECAHRLSGIKRYPEFVMRNIKTAYDQGTKEMIIRLLVLPNHIDCCALPILNWIAQNTPKALVNIMAQYRPLWRVAQHPEQFTEITRRVTSTEIEQTYSYAEKLGLEYRSVS